MTNIKSFIQDISPDQDEREQIATSGKTIRETIEWKLDIISSSKLTGSYIRHTKISPIDDLDIIFCIKAGDTYIEWIDLKQKKWKIYIKDGSYDSHPLKDYAVYSNGKYYISPNKILNKIKSCIAETYSTTSDIKRNWECVTAYLSSYDLTIDCMPYIRVSDKNYILIPTSGNDLYWKKSNPDLDKEKIDELNNPEHFNWKLKGVIKVMKYWNKYKNTWVKFRSYVLECIIYYALKSQSWLYTASYVDILKQVINYFYNKQYHNIPDIPGYDYIYYDLSNEQWEKIKWLLETLWSKLNESEEDFISYLKS